MSSAPNLKITQEPVLGTWDLSRRAALAISAQDLCRRITDRTSQTFYFLWRRNMSKACALVLEPTLDPSNCSRGCIRPAKEDAVDKASYLPSDDGANDVYRKPA